MCCDTKFCRSRSNRFGRRGPKKFLGTVDPAWIEPRPLGTGTYVADRLEIHYSRTYLCYQTFSNRSSVIMEIFQKILTLTPRLSRSFEVIGSDAGRSATYKFLLLFSSINYRPYHLRDKRRLLTKIANFSNPRVFGIPTAGVPLEFCNGCSA